VPSAIPRLKASIAIFILKSPIVKRFYEISKRNKVLRGNQAFSHGRKGDVFILEHTLIGVIEYQRGLIFANSLFKKYDKIYPFVL
jgi:hypothetical protein